MSENRTVPPPKPIRPQARPGKFPVALQETPVPMFPRQESRIRPVQPSDTDLRVAADHERLNAVQRRVDRLEPIFERVDQSVQEMRQELVDEIQDRKLKEVTKTEEKTAEDHKTKRFMALIAALPIILAPLGSIAANIWLKPTPETPGSHIAVPAYIEETRECNKIRDKQAWTECVREAQLRWTPPFKP